MRFLNKGFSIFFFFFFVAVLLYPDLYADNQGDQTKFTTNKNRALLNELPFENNESFKNAKRGFIAPLLNGGIIKNSKGEIVWNLSDFSFVDNMQPPLSTANPSLWRQTQLLYISGLFKVSEGIYQVRSADVTNLTIVEGKDSLVIIDPMLSVEVAKSALDLYYEHRPKKPISAVIYTHSHTDHYGGVRGVISEEDVISGKVKIVAPDGFMKAVSDENVLAGNVMSRRASYVYGNLLEKSPTGALSSGLGLTTSTGEITLIAPTDLITKDYQKMTLAGIEFVFLLAPDSEAPSEMFLYIPEYRALCTAEDAVHTLHNVYTLRGAKIRDPLSWSKYLNEALYSWGYEADVMFAPHNWPIWGKDDIIKHLKLQRDAYRFTNDQALRLANEGYNMTQIAEMIKFPSTIENYWSIHGYYGTLNHNLKGVYVKYLGWFDGNPATLHPLPPVESGKKYVEYMGGADKILEMAKRDYEEGNYRWVAQVLNHLVFAEPSNKEAKDLEASALEQLGYQAESGPWRNLYLTGAQELRYGVKRAPTVNSVSLDTIRNITLENIFDYVGVRLNPDKAAGKYMKVNFIFPDINKKYMFSLENSTINYAEGREFKNPDLSVTIDRDTLDKILTNQTTATKEIESGKIAITGDNKDKLKEFFGMLDKFDLWFNIITPNKQSN